MIPFSEVRKHTASIVKSNKTRHVYSLFVVHKQTIVSHTWMKARECLRNKLSTANALTSLDHCLTCKMKCLTWL